MFLNFLKKNYEKENYHFSSVISCNSVLYFSFAAGFKNEEKTASAILITPPPDTSKDFINCILNDYFRRRTPSGDQMEYNFGKYKELNFNAIHRYSANDTDHGVFGEPLTTEQRDNMFKLYDSAHAKNLKSIYATVNIDFSCFGQRLVYEAEGGNNGFSYQTRTAPVESDTGRMVIHACTNSAACPQTDATPRWLCKNIYENLQHTDDYVFHDRHGFWYLKPMMRIDSSIVDNNPNAPVVRIDVINYNEDTIKSITLRARNFNVGGHYDGRYIDKFVFEQNTDSLKVFASDTLPDGLNYGVSSDWEEWEDNCKIDFKVWWFGQVDVWFDKMTVDDERGNNLLSGLYDDDIMQEVGTFINKPSNFTFFTDEIMYSNLPCVKYVYEVMKDTNSNAKLWYAISTFRNMVGMRNDDDYFGQTLHLDVVKPDYICSDAHVITFGTPDNLPLFQGFPHLNSADYNEALQALLGNKSDNSTNEPVGTMLYQFTTARRQVDSSSPQTKLIMQPQIQTWMTKNIDSGNFTGYREPTNEEGVAGDSYHVKVCFTFLM